MQGKILHVGTCTSVYFLIQFQTYVFKEHQSRKFRILYFSTSWENQSIKLTPSTLGPSTVKLTDHQHRQFGSTPCMLKNSILSKIGNRFTQVRNRKMLLRSRTTMLASEIRPLAGAPRRPEVGFHLPVL